MIASYPERNFQLWEYSVSHGRLLVRSPKSPSIATNVDILFVGVEYVAAPWILRGLDFMLGSEADVRRAEEECVYTHSHPNNKVFVLASEGRRNLVVALAHRIREHDRDIFWSPLNHGRTPPVLE